MHVADRTAEPRGSSVPDTRAQPAEPTTRASERGGQAAEDGASSSMRHTHQAVTDIQQRAMTAGQAERTGGGARRADGKDEEVTRRPSEPMSCAASTTEGMGRQQGRDSSMAATATGMDDKRCSEVRTADGARGGAQSERRRRESGENSGAGSSSTGADSSSNCSSTNVHGTHTERSETADRTVWRQRRTADEAEHGARTVPRREAEGSSSTAAAQAAGESSTATTGKPVDGSVNNGTIETEHIREQRRLLIRSDVQRDVDKKEARRAQYGVLPPVTRGWLEAQQVPGGLRWPHAWKRRPAVATARSAPNAGRSEVRDALRRASARSGAHNYEERERKTRRADAAGERGRRTASTERRRDAVPTRPAEDASEERSWYRRVQHVPDGARAEGGAACILGSAEGMRATAGRGVTRD